MSDQLTERAITLHNYPRHLRNSRATTAGHMLFDLRGMPEIVCIDERDIFSARMIEPEVPCRRRSGVRLCHDACSRFAGDELPRDLGGDDSKHS